MALVTKNLGLIKAIHKGVTPPANTVMIWYNEGDNLHYVYNTDTVAWEPLQGSTNFTDLLDAPSSYTGSAGLVVAVKATEDGLEFVAGGGGGGAVDSVNGQTGTVVLTTTHIAEGSNLYYTSARFNTALATKTTTDLAEGSNLYYTNARGIASVLTGYTSGAGTVAATDTILQAIQKLNGNIAALTTSSVSEGSNLYFTDARARTAVFSSLTTNYHTKYNGTNLVNSLIFDDGTYVSIGIATGTRTLSFSGNAAITLGAERHTTADTAGNDFTINAGSATTNAVNKAGGNLYLRSGQSTGSGVSYIYFQAPTTNGSSATDGTMATRVTISHLGLGIGVTPSYALDLSGVMNIAETGFLRIAGNKYLHYTHSTLTSVTSGNTYLGYNVALSGTGGGNSGFGASALAANTSGANNTAFGAGALAAVITASFNTAIGADAGSATTGAGNVLVGRRAGQKNEGGSYNTFVGTDSCALYGSALTGSYNVGLGYTAGLYISGSSAFCIGVGLEAGGLVSGTSYQHSLAIGAYAKFTASKQVVIAGAGNAYIYNDFLLGTNMEPTEDTSEYDLTIRVGESKFNTRNNMGGNNLIIRPGVSRGDGSAFVTSAKSGDFIIQTTNVGAAAGVVNTFSERMRVKGATGYIGLQGITSPTAFLHLAAGTTAAASMKITPGVAPSSPNDGDVYYIDTNDRLMFYKNATASEIISASAVTTEAQTSDTTLTITYNGTTYKLLAKA